MTHARTLESRTRYVERSCIELHVHDDLCPLPRNRTPQIRWQRDMAITECLSNAYLDWPHFNSRLTLTTTLLLSCSSISLVNMRTQLIIWSHGVLSIVAK